MAGEEGKDPGAVPSGVAGDGDGTPTPAVTTEAGAGEGAGETGWREERAQILERLAAAESRLQQGAGAGGDPPTTGSDPERAAIAERLRENAADLAEARRLAANNDPLAKMLVKSLEATATDLRRMSARLDIADYVSELPAEHRRPFRAYLAKEGNRFADLDAAFDAYEAVLLRATKGKTKSAQEIADAIARDRSEGRVGASPRGVPAAEARERAPITEDQMRERLRAFEEAEDYEGLRQFQRDVRSGKVPLRK